MRFNTIDVRLPDNHPLFPGYIGYKVYDSVNKCEEYGLYFRSNAADKAAEKLNETLPQEPIKSKKKEK